MIGPKSFHTTKETGLKAPKITEIVFKNEKQRRLAKAVFNDSLVFAIGPAGTGKTMIVCAVAAARINRGVELGIDKFIDKIIVTRPNIVGGGGKTIGCLPGTVFEKMAAQSGPVLKYLDDTLCQTSGKRKNLLREEHPQRTVELVPFEFMRGASYDNAVVIIDDAQNATEQELRLVLTRAGNGTVVVLTGDPYQCDIRHDGKVPLMKMADMLWDLPDVSRIDFDLDDVERSEHVKNVLKRFYEHDRKNGAR